MTTSTDSKSIQSPGRRGWLKLLLGLTAAGFFAQIGRATGSFLLPRRKENVFGGRIQVGPVAQIPIPDAEPKLYPAGKFWLVNNDGKLSALHSSCTHLNCLFTWDSNKGVFVCPCHGSEFSRHGEVLKGPAERNLDYFPLEIIDGDEKRIMESATALELGSLPVAAEGQEPLDMRLFVDTGRKIKGETKAVL